MHYLIAKDSLNNDQQLGSLDKAVFMVDLQNTSEQLRDQIAQKRHLGHLLIALLVTLFSIAITLAFVLYSYRQIRHKNRVLYQNYLELLSSEKEKKQLISKYEDGRGKEADGGELLHRVLAVMETSPEVYSEAFSIVRLAELVGSKRTYVSQAINQGSTHTFTDLLTEYRIKEACRRMSDTANYGNLTIESIANSVGIKSRTNFVANFKKQVGITPSAYLKLAKERQKAH